MNPLIRIIEIRINQYKRLKTKIYHIVEAIDLVVEDLKVPKSGLINYFQIEDFAADNNTIAKNYDKLLDISSKLSDRIIPSIDYEIRKLKRKRTEIEQKMEEVNFYGLY